MKTYILRNPKTVEPQYPARKSAEGCCRKWVAAACSGKSRKGKEEETANSMFAFF
jgi:hypothetical protein